MIDTETTIRLAKRLDTSALRAQMQLSSEKAERATDPKWKSAHAAVADALTRELASRDATHPYLVEYETASGDFRELVVEAVDAIDAKHVAESREGEVIVEAHATRSTIRPHAAEPSPKGRVCRRCLARLDHVAHRS